MSNNRILSVTYCYTGKSKLLNNVNGMLPLKRNNTFFQRLHKELQSAMAFWEGNWVSDTSQYISLIPFKLWILNTSLKL